MLQSSADLYYNRDQSTRLHMQASTCRHANIDFHARNVNMRLCNSGRRSQMDKLRCIQSINQHCWTYIYGNLKLHWRIKNVKLLGPRRFFLFFLLSFAFSLPFSSQLALFLFTSYPSFLFVESETLRMS